MPSAIDVTVPGTNSALVSANVRTNFSTAAGEITALQAQVTTVQGNVGTLQTSVSALQTKTTVSGDASLGANGTLTVSALQGRTVSATPPAANQVLAWSGSQWVPTDATGGIAEPAAGTAVYGRGGTPTPSWQAVLPIAGGTLTGILNVGTQAAPVPGLNVYGEVTTRGINATYNYESKQASPPGDPRSVWSLWANGVGDDSYTIISNGSSSGIMGPAPEYPRLRIQNNGIHVYGGVVVGFNPAPPTANMGPGTINAENGLYINGVAVGTGAGSVTQITAGTGLATTPAAGVTTTGSIALATIGAGSGPHTNATVTVDAYGRVTAVATGAAGGAGSSSAAATATGRLFVNLNTAPTIQASGAAVQVTGTDAAADASTTVVIDAVVQPIIRTRKAMTSMTATAAGTAAMVPNNQAIFLLDMQGYNGSANGFAGGAQIRAAATAAWTAGNLPTRMEFWTTRPNMAVPQTSMTITSLGAVIVGGAPDPGIGGTVSAVSVWAAGDDLHALIDALDARITALGG